MTTPKPKAGTASSPQLQAISDLVETAGHLTLSSVIIPGGTRIEDLRLVEAARDQGIVDRVWLVGDSRRVRAAAQEAEVAICEDDIIHAETEDAIAQATVQQIATGKVDVILKGNISTTIMNRNMLGMAERATVTLTTLFDAASIAQGRPMLLTDAGFTTVCTFGRLQDMIRNAVDVAQAVMGIPRPRVAVLSANEKQIPSLPSTRLGLELAQRDWPDAVVCGPLSFDLATSSESVAIKGMPNVPNAQDVAGQADILVCPGIDAANILYKAITALTKYGLASLAGITVGFPIPYVILSRSDTLETRLNSVALSCVFAQRRKVPQPQSPQKVHAAGYASVPRVLTLKLNATALKVAVFENDNCIHESDSPLRNPARPSSDSSSQRVEQMAGALCQELSQQGITEIHAVSSYDESQPGTNAQLQIDCLVDPQNRGVVLQEGAALAPPEHEPTSPLTGLLTLALALHFQAPGFQVKPASTQGDESSAKQADSPPVKQQNTPHSLSIHMAGERAALSVGRNLKDINLVVAHLSEETTIASLCQGKMLDSSVTCLDSNAIEAGIYEVSKGIGAGFVAAGCDVEAIVLTGDLVRNSKCRSALRKRVARLAPVLVYEKAIDMEHLAQKARQVLASPVQTKRNPADESISGRNRK